MRGLVRLVVVLLATVALVAPSTPASAHEDACAGWGLFIEGEPLGEMGLSPMVTTTFWTNIVVGTCAASYEFSAIGTISGWCTSASGTGTTSTGHNFSFTVKGTMVTVIGEVNGVGHLSTVGRSTACIYGSYYFTAFWSLALSHI